MNRWTLIPLTVGVLETNCYLLKDNETGSLVCIDPGSDSADILQRAADENATPLAILLTHGHGDHLGAVSAVHEAWNVPIGIHKDDADMLTSAEKNLSAAIGMHVSGPDASHILEGDESVTFGPFAFTALHTPGHTRGGTCYYIEPPDDAPILFSGDTLFYGDVGRCDLPGGSLEQLTQSIQEKLYVLPDETKVYPGHGPSSTIGREKVSNLYVQA